MKKWHRGLKVLVITLALFLAFPFNTFADAAKASTRVKHKSPEYYIPGFRIILDAEIKEEAGVLVARCYFKTKRDKNFVFVDMLPKGNPGYQATLPAPWVNSEFIEYVFVVVNKDKKVIRTQVFTMEEKETTQAAAWKEAGEVKELRLDEVQEVLDNYNDIKQSIREEYKNKLPKWQVADSQRGLGIFTEFESPSEQIKGFYDYITVTTVSSSSKYGVMAEGLYTDAEITTLGGKTAAASTTGATTAGTISAAAGGISLGTIALGAAAVVAGAAAAGGGGGGDAAPAPSISSGLSDVTVSQTNITITVWDDALVDGDQVDLTVNGISVFNNHVLVGPPGTTRNVLLNSGNNNLVVQADNEGGSPPNTAAITISNVISGNPNQSWSLSSGQTTTMTISAP